MGRKSVITDKRARRYIRILDEDKWAEIDKLRTIKKYDNSFNQLINDALDYGLPLLVKAEFGEVKSDGEYIPAEPPVEESYPKEADMYYRLDELLDEIVGLLQEVVMNVTINKSLICSLFNMKIHELSTANLLARSFKSGDMRDTPDYLENYELRAMKEINQRRRKD